MSRKNEEVHMIDGRSITNMRFSTDIVYICERVMRDVHSKAVEAAVQYAFSQVFANIPFAPQEVVTKFIWNNIADRRESPIWMYKKELPGGVLIRARQIFIFYMLMSLGFIDDVSIQDVKDEHPSVYILHFGMKAVCAGLLSSEQCSSKIKEAISFARSKVVCDRINSPKEKLELFADALQQNITNECKFPVAYLLRKYSLDASKYTFYVEKTRYCYHLLSYLDILSPDACEERRRGGSSYGRFTEAEKKWVKEMKLLHPEMNQVYRSLTFY